jgi:glutathione reductase (NADPH)
MNAFGVKTSLIIRDVPLRHVDSEVVDLLVESMKKLGLDIRLHTPFTKVTKDESTGELTVHLSDGSHITGDKVLVALGRPPLIDDLGLGDIGVNIEKGAVKVDEFQCTSVPHIFAIGDVTN